VDVRVNSSVQLAPSVTRFRGRASQPVGTPAIDSNMLRDVYLTFDAIGAATPISGPQVVDDLPNGSVLLGVTVEPLLSWLWIGGIMIGIGSALAFARRPAREIER
jgi:cytochrome c-type biogenesis protein CcmF